MRTHLILPLAFTLAAGCSSAGPRFIHNAKYEQTSQPVVERDIADCSRQADAAGGMQTQTGPVAGHCVGYCQKDPKETRKENIAMCLGMRGYEISGWG